MAGPSSLQGALGAQLMEVAKVMEEQVDSEMSRLENLDEESLEEIRRRRIEQIKKAQAERQEQLAAGHGRYEEVADEKEFFATTKRSKKVVAHFYLDSSFRCKIVDKHLEKLAPRHLGTRFIKINAEKAPFITNRLNIRVIPTLAIVVDAVTVDYIRGFDDLGGTDEFKTEVLEDRLARSGVIDVVDRKKPESKNQKSIRSGTTAYDNEEDW